jgi:aminoglycoside 2''-phosphotransferase
MIKPSLNKAKRIINDDYPEFIIKSIKPLKGGWDNFVFLINEKYIFRFPKKETFNLDKEINVLAHLQNKITLEIPNYEFIGKKVRYVGYQKIVGEAVTAKLLATLTKKEKEILAHDIARFFYEFHKSLPIKIAKGFKLKKNTEGWRPVVIKRTLLKKLNDPEILKFIKVSLKKYSAIRQDKSKLIIAFSDLHGDNMAFNKITRRLTGIFDFSDVAIEFLDREFSHLFSVDQELNLEIVKYYQKLSRRRINLENVWLYSIIGEASIMTVYNEKPKSEIYQLAKTNLLRLKAFKF